MMMIMTTSSFAVANLDRHRQDIIITSAVKTRNVAFFFLLQLEPKLVHPQLQCAARHSLSTEDGRPWRLYTSTPFFFDFWGSIPFGSLFSGADIQWHRTTKRCLIVDYGKVDVREPVHALLGS